MTMMQQPPAVTPQPGQSSFTPERGREICRRVAGGASLRQACAAADMPDRGTVWNWTRAHPDFASDLSDAMRAARLERRLRDRARAHAAAARPRFNHRGRASTYTPELAAEICARIADGESLLSICDDPGMPRPCTVYDWIGRHADFEDAYVRARQRQADTLFDEAREVGLAATPATVWADRLRFDTIRWITARLAPKKYCERLIVAQALKPSDGGGLTVIVKRYSDVTPEEEALGDEGEV